jgi:hypothetical protein
MELQDWHSQPSSLGNPPRRQGPANNGYNSLQDQQRLVSSDSHEMMPWHFQQQQQQQQFDSRRGAIQAWGAATAPAPPTGKLVTEPQMQQV